MGPHNLVVNIFTINPTILNCETYVGPDTGKKVDDKEEIEYQSIRLNGKITR